MKNCSKTIKIILITAAWLLIWQAAAVFVGNKLLLTGPLETVAAAFKIVTDTAKLLSICYSALRILGGFLLALMVAVILAALSYICKGIEEFLVPPIMVCKSVPVAAIIVIALIWMGSELLPLLIVFLIAFPIMYQGLLKELKAVDPEQIKLADVFGIKPIKRIRPIYIPAVRDGFLSSCRLAVSMSFKAGVAAEVIAQPLHSIGERLYLSKLYLNVDELFAWTFIIVLLAFISEKIVVLIIKCIFNLMMGDLPEKNIGYEMTYGPAAVLLDNVSRKYGEKELFGGLSAKIIPGIWAVTGDSGAGKTTFLNMILGYVRPDEGSVSYQENTSVMFQKTVLFEHLSAISNVAYFCNGDTSGAERILRELLAPELLKKAVRDLSGGERRRVELARALVCGTVCLLDEPFSGLDSENCVTAQKIIEKYSENRIIIIAVHDINELKNIRNVHEIKL